MNPARAIGRLARIVAALATAVLAVTAATAAALATPRPLPPGWNKHPPLPGHIHAMVTSGMPGWQVALIAIAGVVLVAAVHAPRPGLGTRRKTGIKGPDIDNKSLRPCWTAP